MRRTRKREKQIKIGTGVERGNQAGNLNGDTACQSVGSKHGPGREDEKEKGTRCPGGGQGVLLNISEGPGKTFVMRV